MCVFICTRCVRNKDNNNNYGKHVSFTPPHPPPSCLVCASDIFTHVGAQASRRVPTG